MRGQQHAHPGADTQHLGGLPPGTRAERALQAIETHETGFKLRETLAVYLDQAGNVPRAAKALNLHRTSLYYRLRQIQEITGMDLDSGTGCFGKDCVPRRSCLSTRKPTIGFVSRYDEPSCPFTDFLL
ncbi:helix-turn-helix domain-containing protein [Streptomyces sp. NPDC005356]|uniref:helix-turn-helix domain-containing protein n=1 Tax=Streptomyces sp. NPDC005356 TaxID=3157167 RepID=UPI0033B5985F